MLKNHSRNHSKNQRTQQNLDGGRRNLTLDSMSQSPNPRADSSEKTHRLKKKRIVPQSASSKHARMLKNSASQQILQTQILSTKSSMQNIMSIPESYRHDKLSGVSHSRPQTSQQSQISQSKQRGLKRNQGARSTLDLLGQNSSNNMGNNLKSPNGFAFIKNNNFMASSNGLRPNTTSNQVNSRPMTSTNALLFTHFICIRHLVFIVKVSLVLFWEDKEEVVLQDQQQHFTHKMEINIKPVSKAMITYLKATCRLIYLLNLSQIFEKVFLLFLKLAEAKKNLSMKSTISTWTKQENQVIDKTLETITTLQRNYERKTSMANLDKVDCKNYLLKANREIKCLNYELMNIVQSRHDDLGNIIVARKPFDIEVIQEAHMIFKVQVRSQPSPAKFQIQYRELPTGSLRSDLKVWL